MNMNWLLKLLGYRDRTFEGDDFRVRIKPSVREGMLIDYKRRGVKLNLKAQHIGNKWKDIEVHIPGDVEVDLTPRIVADLETAFRAMGYGYVIARKVLGVPVAGSDRQAAIATLRNLGYDVAVLEDGKVSHASGLGQGSIPEELKDEPERLSSLLQTASGTRSHLEILARSEGRREGVRPQ